MENGWNNTKRAKGPYFHSGTSIKNYRLDRVCKKKRIVK